MFFIGIFGIESKKKDIKALTNIQCKNCNINTDGSLIKVYNVFHFFFIPLIKWNERYFVVCKNCGFVYEIPKDKGKGIERGDSIEINYWDLKSAEGIPFSHPPAEFKCKNCGRVIKPDYEYCPYCGNKRE